MNDWSPLRKLKDLAAAAMIGTDRSSAAGKPDALLHQAAVFGTQARAGFKPRTIAAALPPCPQDATPVAGTAPMATLARLLASPDFGMITEWAELASAKNLRVADAAVPLLLDWWSRQPRRPETAFSVLGKRGNWLASLNADWRKPVAGSEVPANSDEIWQTGTTPQRAALLLTVRRLDPSRARSLVQSTWESDGADEHRKFIEVLNEKRSMTDEPFLESVLDDKSNLVRKAAAAVLSQITGSRFKMRMNERARTMVILENKRGVLKRTSKVTLSPPQEFDKSWERDGIEEQPPSGTGSRAWWLRQILAAADLSVWTDVSGLDPSGVLKIIAADDYFGTVLEAMSDAAAVCGDVSWSTAIMGCRLAGDKLELRELQKVWRNLTPEQSESLALEAAAHKRFTVAERWMILASGEHRWSLGYSAAALKLLKKPQEERGDAFMLYEQVERASRRVAPQCAEQFVEAVATVSPNGKTDSFIKSIDRARQRAEIHKEFEV
jgi:hypothetical protein